MTENNTNEQLKKKLIEGLKTAMEKSIEQLVEEVFGTQPEPQEPHFRYARIVQEWFPTDSWRGQLAGLVLQVHSISATKGLGLWTPGRNGISIEYWDKSEAGLLPKGYVLTPDETVDSRRPHVA